jgi:hypothetical protein
MKTWIAALALVAIGFVAGSLTPVGKVFAQIFSPAAVNGCIYNASGFTLFNKQSAAFSCDANGNLKVN